MAPLAGSSAEVPFFVGSGTISFEVALDAIELKSFKVTQ